MITIVMMFFLIAGALDQALFRGKYGLGKEFVKGLNAVGPLLLSMAGIMCIAPAIGKTLYILALPFFNHFGADPAIAAGMFFGIDMGGYALTESMTGDIRIVLLGGVLLGSTLGTTVVFTIPVMLTVCRPEDQKSLSRGIVIGIISIPFGVTAGALLSGIPLLFLITNAAPAFLFSLILAVSMILFQSKTMTFFSAFGRVIQALSVLAFAAAALEEILDFTVIPGMDPLGEQLKTISLIGVTLAGAYPLLHLLIRLLAPALKKLGALLRINSSAVTAMLASLANPFPFFDMVPAMDSHGKVIATAFMVTAMASFGDHLGFLSVTFPEAIPAMIVTKLVCALSGLLLAECFEYGFHNFRNAVKE